MQILIDIPSDFYEVIMDNRTTGLDWKDEEDLIRKGIPLGITNGDLIKSMFPNLEIIGSSEKTIDFSLGGFIHRVLKSWWNSAYKRNNKDE